MLMKHISVLITVVADIEARPIKIKHITILLT